MFNYLFNTYESVTPPSKAKPDIKGELYLELDFGIESIDPLGFYPFFRIPYVDKSLDQSYELESPQATMEEPLESQISNPLINQLVSNIVNTGRSFIGGKYTWGGKNPNTGFDCSGFISYIYGLNGITIPSSSSDLFKIGREVALNEAQPGDIICSKGSGPSRRHVLMVSRVDPENNLIYVIEAKGRKYGIVEGLLTKKASDIISVRRVLNLNNTDPFLTNLDIQSPFDTTSITRSGKFSNLGDFIKALNAGYQKALLNKGLDPNYSYILTALAAIESGWGKHLAGNFNFGGIKISDREAKAHPERANRALTTDWSKERGYFKHYQNFRNFSSIEDYCNYKINLLSNNRYNVFDTVPVTNPYNFIFHILSRGYGSDYGGPESRKYVSKVMRNYNTVINTLRT